MNIAVFLPCRAGSERVKDKNTRPFASYPLGLVQLKIEQLLRCEFVRRICLSTNDPKVIGVAAGFSDSRIDIDHRPDPLCSSLASTDDLVRHAAGLFQDDEMILWTHVTSPFVGPEVYQDAIRVYEAKLEEGYDSLMSVSEIRKFVWDAQGPVNYDRTVEKWPRTQTLPVLYEINSAIFISSRQNYVKHSDRIGRRPFLLPLDQWSALDIDWEDDFLLGEQVYMWRQQCRSGRQDL